MSKQRCSAEQMAALGPRAFDLVISGFLCLLPPLIRRAVPSLSFFSFRVLHVSDSCTGAAVLPLSVFMIPILRELMGSLLALFARIISAFHPHCLRKIPGSGESLIALPAGTNRLVPKVCLACPWARPVPRAKGAGVCRVLAQPRPGLTCSSGFPAGSRSWHLHSTGHGLFCPAPLEEQKKWCLMEDNRKTVQASLMPR